MTSEDPNNRCGRSAVMMALVLSTVVFWGGLLVLALATSMSWGLVIGGALAAGVSAFAATYAVLFLVYRVRASRDASPVSGGQQDPGTYS